MKILFSSQLMNMFQDLWLSQNNGANNVNFLLISGFPHNFLRIDIVFKFGKLSKYIWNLFTYQGTHFCEELGQHAFTYSKINLLK